MSWLRLFLAIPYQQCYLPHPEKATVQVEYPQAASPLPVLLANIPLFERLRQSLGVYNSEEVEPDSELDEMKHFLAAAQHALHCWFYHLRPAMICMAFS